MNASNVQPALFMKDFHLDLACDAPSSTATANPSIDDPVNDTGFGPGHGDLQLVDEFACFVRLICDGRGEFS